VVFLSFSIDGSKLSSPLHIQLLPASSPLASRNFYVLCKGGFTTTAGKQLKGYAKNRSHRIIRNFMLQAGDTTKGDGTGGASMYAAGSAEAPNMWGKFKDDVEGLELKHDKRGTLSMANSGPDSNSSQFFVTFREVCKSLDGKHVVFGRVVDAGGEVEGIMRALEECGSTGGGGDPGRGGGSGGAGVGGRGGWGEGRVAHVNFSWP